MKRPRDPDHLLKLGEIIIIQDNRPDITITVSEGASMKMVGYLPPHAALCQHTQNTSATLVSIAMLLSIFCLSSDILRDKPLGLRLSK